MIQISDISLGDYLKLDDKSEYYFAMKYSNVFNEPIDEFKVGDIMELSFGFIKDLQFELEQGITFSKQLEILQELTGKNIIKEKLSKICRQICYLMDGMELISKAELKLVRDPSGEELGANIDRFEGLGIFLQFDSLTGGDITKYDNVRKLPYHLCYTKLYCDKQKYEYEQDIIKNRRHHD